MYSGRPDGRFINDWAKFFVGLAVAGGLGIYAIRELREALATHPQTADQSELVSSPLSSPRISVDLTAIEKTSVVSADPQVPSAYLGKVLIAEFWRVVLALLTAKSTQLIAAGFAGIGAGYWLRPVLMSLAEWRNRAAAHKRRQQLEEDLKALGLSGRSEPEVEERNVYRDRKEMFVAADVYAFPAAKL